MDIRTNIRGNSFYWMNFTGGQNYVVRKNIPCCGGQIQLNSFPASGDFCCLPITFANSLDLDLARQNVGSELDPNCLTLMIFLTDIIEKVN